MLKRNSILGTSAVTLGLVLTSSIALAAPSNFHKVTKVTGLSVADLTNALFSTPVSGGGTYKINLASGATFRLDGSSVDHPISEIFGFYQVYDDESATLASKSTTTGWAPSTLSASGGVALGFDTKPQFSNLAKSLGLYPAGTAGHTNVGSLSSFTFGASTIPGTKKSIYWGFDIATSDNGVFGTNDDGVNTGKIYLPSGVLPPTGDPVPEPAFYQMTALLTLGGIGALRMRRARRN